MNDTHDMTEHELAAKADVAAHVPASAAHAAHDKDSSNTDSHIKPPRILTLLDPKIEHTRDAWHDLKASANNLFLTARYHSIRALPAAVVNNSTNILGATHVMTEMMMLKASGNGDKLIKDTSNPINWVWQPLENVFKGTFKAASIQKTNPELMPSTGNWFKDKYEFIVDTKKATQRELDRQQTSQVKSFAENGGKTFAETDYYKKIVKPKLQNIERETERALTAEESKQFISSEREIYRNGLREKLKSELGFQEIEGRGLLATNKEAYTERLTAELNGMNEKSRVAAMKSRMGELQEISGGPVYSNMRLSNPWQMRSTLAGLVVWALSAVIPDKKESDDEVERMAVKRHTNPLGYVGERFKQAVWVPEWASHKRQMIGLGIMTSGLCSLLGSWRNRKTLLNDAQAVVEFAELLGKQGMLEKGATQTVDQVVKFTGKEISKDVAKATRYEYEFNPSYFATSLLTFLSSLPLLFASDNERGFSGFGALMTGRLIFLPSSIGKKMRDKEPGVGFYTAGMASFQAENWAQALAGGAEKKKDPKTGAYTIVDHDDERRNAQEKAKSITSNRKEQKDEQRAPSRIVTYVSDHEMAMPEHVQTHEQQKASAV